VKILIKDADLVVTQNSRREILRGASIFIENDIIKAIGDYKDLEGLGANTEVDARGLAVIPGLINLHTHSTQTATRGLLEDIPLMAWLYRIDKIYESIDEEAIGVASKLSFLEGLFCGTTTFVDMELSYRPVISAAREVGVRLFEAAALVDTQETGPSGFERINDPDEIVKKVVRDAVEFKEDPLVKLGLGPVGIPSSSPELLRIAAIEARRNGLFVQTHSSESQVNEKIARKLYGLSETLLLEKMGVLGPWLIIVHGVNLTRTDIDTLAKHGVSVAHCPTSNAKLGNGVAPAWHLISRGVNLGLGTDGASSNNSLDLFQEIKTFILMQRAILKETVLSAQQAFDAATINGARALRITGKIGSIQPGAYADLVLVDLRSLYLQPSTMFLENLVFSGGCKSVKHVFVNGKLLVKDGLFIDPTLVDKIITDFEGAFERIQKILV